MNKLYSNTLVHFSYFFCGHCRDSDSLSLINTYHSMFDVFNVNWNYCILFDVFHRSELICQAWRHNVGAFQNKLGCSRINLKSREHIGVHVDEFQRWNGFLFNPQKVVIVIYDNVFAFLLIASFHLKGHDFGFFVPEDGDLLIREFRFGQ